MVNFICELILLLSEEKKAFLLKLVNKENSGACQGCDKQLDQKMGRAGIGIGREKERS